MSSQHNPAVCFLNVRPVPLPLAIKQTTGTRWHCAPAVPVFMECDCNPLLSSKNQPCLTKHRSATGFVRLRSPRILPLPIRLAKLSGCRWLVNAHRQDPRVYYFQRSLPPIVSQSSLGPVPKDLLTIRRQIQLWCATACAYETNRSIACSTVSSGKSLKAARCSSQSESRPSSYFNFERDHYYEHRDIILSCPIQNLISKPASDHTGVDNFSKLHPDIQISTSSFRGLQCGNSG